MSAPRGSSALKRVGWAAIALGVAITVASGITLGVRIGSYVSHGIMGPTYSTPVDRTIEFDAGTYVVFERTGAEAAGSTATPGQVVSLRPDQVRITRADGRVLSTGRPSGTQTITRNGAIFTGAVSFHVPSHGRYSVQITSDRPAGVLISRDFGSMFLSVVVWILLAALGVLMVIGGIVVLVVNGSRRARPTPLTGGPGWYPDPANPGRSRWWNGQSWSP